MEKISQNSSINHGKVSQNNSSNDCGKIVAKFVSQSPRKITKLFSRTQEKIVNFVSLLQVETKKFAIQSWTIQQNLSIDCRGKYSEICRLIAGEKCKIRRSVAGKQCDLCQSVAGLDRCFKKLNSPENDETFWMGFQDFTCESRHPSLKLHFVDCHILMILMLMSVFFCHLTGQTTQQFQLINPEIFHHYFYKMQCSCTNVEN